MSMRQSYLSELRNFPDKYQGFHDNDLYIIDDLSNRQLEKFIRQDLDYRQLLDTNLGIRRDNFTKRKRDFSTKKK